MMKRMFRYLLFVAMSLATIFTSGKVEAASNQVNQVELQATAGIVMDAETGQIIGGKNVNQALYPASTTKILTALIVLENCELDEVVTFSKNAVYNVDKGSTNVNSEAGDQLTVRDCLYALLLHSANEVANALAEHVAGSIENFSVLMNEKARSLQCTDSNFANPSGLNNPDHYVTAKDMALIAREAYYNKEFMKIIQTSYYDLPKTIRNEDGLRIYNKHKLYTKNSSLYYNGCEGGKTGYTMLAKNTLVTYAKRDDLSLIAVVLNADQTHYEDTIRLFEYGYQNYEKVRFKDNSMLMKQIQAILDTEQYLRKENNEIKLLLPKNYNQKKLVVALDTYEKGVKEEVVELTISYKEQEVYREEVVKAMEEEETVETPSKSLNEDQTGETPSKSLNEDQGNTSEKNTTKQRIMWVIFFVVVLGIGYFFWCKIKDAKKNH